VNAKPIFLFGPGAGAPCSHPWIQAWIQRLSAIGEVASFDYDYMTERRGRPEPLPMLVARHKGALEEVRMPGRPTILIGKSMGGRIGCHVALEEPVDGLVCLGYPLCGGGYPRKLRDKVLRDLRTPILFVQGTRDPLCPLELLEKVRSEMTVENFLHVVDGGDHSLLVGKKQLRAAGETQDNVDVRILAAISGFVGRLCETPS
jgi:predicted alpha/beta-hydrolase family hydrolase